MDKFISSKHTETSTATLKVDGNVRFPRWTFTRTQGILINHQRTMEENCPPSRPNEVYFTISSGSPADTGLNEWKQELVCSMVDRKKNVCKQSRCSGACRLWRGHFIMFRGVQIMKGALHEAPCPGLPVRKREKETERN